MQYDKLELYAGDDQLIVVYVNQDTAEAIEASTLFAEVAREAADRRVNGWRLMSIASMPMRQMGTAGNIMFQSGGQYATQVALVVVFSATPA